VTCPGCGAPDDQGCYRGCPEARAREPRVPPRRKRARWTSAEPPTLDDQLSEAQLLLRDGYNDDLAAAIANARDKLNAAPKIATREDVKDVYAEGVDVGLDLGKKLGVTIQASSVTLQHGPRPRVHGNGFIQLDLSETVRLHVWGHRDIPRQAVPTQVHDHTFNFRSRVLVGAITNVVYGAIDDPDGSFMVYEAQPNVGEDTRLVSTGRRVRLVECSRLWIQAGDSYLMAAGEFHESIVSRPTATVITKTATQLRPIGRTLVPVGAQPDNAFNRYGESPEKLWRIIAEVLGG